MGADNDENMDEDLDYDAREDEIYLFEGFSIGQKSVNYIYDFGDYWEHHIKLERIFPQKENFPSPLCVGGKRAAPPEDCGGIFGYEKILKIIHNPKHPKYQETREWVGRNFDP